MFYIILVGPAGSGKSHLADSLAYWMELNQLDVAKVNLDPAAEWTPYTPDVDVRNYVNARDVMSKYKLGPNGALVVSIDLLVNHIQELKEEIEATRANYAIVDTPGQMELFAFRETGPAVLRELVGSNKAVAVFLIDAVFASTAASLVSSLFLAASTKMRLGLPLVIAVSKADLLDQDKIGELEEELRDLDSLYSKLVSQGVDPLMAEATIRVLEALSPPEASPGTPLRFCSAISGYGVDDLYAALQQVLAGGEDFYTEEPNPRL
ncbi:MAG: ATP/GTP-binding protein [Thermoproteota archaeon]